MEKNEMQVFQNNEFSGLRTIVIEGVPYFMGVDMCRIEPDERMATKTQVDRLQGEAALLMLRERMREETGE